MSDPSTRAAVLAIFTSDPAASIGTISKRLRIGYSTVAHHRRALLAAGSITLPADNRPPTSERVAAAVLADPTASNAVIGSRVGLSPSAIRRIRWDLANAGVVPPHTARRPVRPPRPPPPPKPPTRREKALDLAQQLRDEPLHPGALLVGRMRLLRLLHWASREAVR